MDLNGLDARPSPEVPAIPASMLYAGNVDLDVVAGKTLKIETTPDGEEVFSTQVPTGKKWEVTVKLSIKETDA